MEDEASTSLDGKLLGNLRVVDLKQELEKRGLSKSGSKKDLVKRLKQQLEFEKLCEERKSSAGDFDRKLELDAEIQQNEFVQQYLAQQRKRYAERKEEEKRLEELQKQDDGQEPQSSEATADKNQDSDSDETTIGKSSQIDKPSKKVEQCEKKDDDNMQVAEALSEEERRSNSSETEDEEPICPLSPPVSKNIRKEQRSPQTRGTKQADENQNTTKSLVDISQKEEIVSPSSPPVSENIRTEQRSPQTIGTEQADKNQNNTNSAVDITQKEEIVGPSSPTVSENSRREQKSPQTSETEQADESRNDTKSLVDTTQMEKIVSPSSPPVSENIRTEQRSPQTSGTEQSGKNQNNINSAVDITQKGEIVGPSSPTGSENSRREQRSPQTGETEQADESQNDTKSLVDITQMEKTVSPSSPPVSENIRTEQRSLQTSGTEQADKNKNNTNSVVDMQKEEIVGPSSPPISENITEPSSQSSETEQADENQTNIKSLVNITRSEEIIKNISAPSSPESGEGKLETPKYCEMIPEKSGSEHIDISSSIVLDGVKGETDRITHENISHSYDVKPEILMHDLNDAKDNNETPSNVAQDITGQTECVEPPSNILDATEENNRCISQCHASAEESSSPENLCKQDSMASKESSECSSVPYSLSDIQLPESPGHHLKCKDLNEEKCIETEPVPEVAVDQNLTSDTKIQSNGVSAVDTLNSTNEEVASESETKTKESINSPDSPPKANKRKESDSNQVIVESSDVESDKNDSQFKKKTFNSEDTSSNIAVDSEEEKTVKDAVSKGQKSVKHRHQSDESDNDKSSDSDKYQYSESDQRHRARGKQRKRIRHSRSRSLSSSSTHSSDSSPKRRRSKKSVVTVKSKNFVENDESNPVSEKSLDDKPDKEKNEDSLLESVSSVPSKKRLKIKRNNVPLEVNTPNVESVESTSSKSIGNIASSNSHSVSEKQQQEESTDVKLSFTELPYAPRKVSLSNRKLNRKSSEDKNNEPKSKRNKWESFAAAQKVSQTISISTDSLKTWFPDFKLMSEPPSSMEIEPDEHSSSAADDKITNLVNVDVSNISDNGMKQESTLHMDVEDSVSQEPNFEDSAEQGPVSKIIFIQNLVRPFTLNQLKDLLKQNGKIVEEYFWIDKIKSKCFVMYETEKEAVKARSTLNNTRWPSSNPKILSVEFSNEEEMEQHKKGNEPQPKQVVEPPIVPEVPEVIETRVSHPEDDHKRKDRERRKERERSKPLPPVREWDKDKVMQDSPEREHIPKEEKSRSSDKKEKKESKKRPNEDTPAKLLDDLFQKTKNPPCIYWLPLTEEQAKQKEEAKKMRKLEREKRNQQLKEQEEAERRNKRARSSRRSREKENRKSSTRSRSPVTRRR